jgi:hypothetical protein
MPYDPRMLQMARMGAGMMGPQASPFDRANQPQRWWEQAMPVGRMGGAQSPQDDPSNPDDPNAPKKPPPSLLQMLMLGGKPSYSGTPAGAGSPQAKAWTDMQSLFKSAGPYGLLGGMGMPGGAGWGGGGTPG